jgi:hypothetical protein
MGGQEEKTESSRGMFLKGVFAADKITLVTRHFVLIVLS